MDYLAFILSLFFCALVSSDGNIKENEPTESVTLSDIMNGIRNVRIDLVSLKDKVDSNKNAIEKVQQKVDYVDKKVDSSITKIGNVDTKVDSSITKIVNVDKKVESNAKSIQKINTEVKSTDVTDIMRAIHKFQADVVFIMDQVNDNSEGINGFGGVVSLSEGGHVTKRYYNDYKISFIGYGYCSYWDGNVGKSGVSFLQCLEYCHTVREERGATWDDLYYCLSKKQCECGQRARGHTVSEDCLHYHFL